MKKKLAPGLVQDMIKNSQKGDLAAFQNLVEQFQEYIFILAVRLLGNEEDARDAVQETFIRAWKHIGRFHFGNKFTTWLYRIVTNLCYDRLKAQKRRNLVFDYHRDDDQERLLQSADDFDLEEVSIKKDLVDKIIAFAQELTPKQRLVFVLRDLQDASVDEVAHITGMSSGSIKTNLYYARRFIREKLLTADQPGQVRQEAEADLSWTPAQQEVKK